MVLVMTLMVIPRALDNQSESRHKIKARMDSGAYSRSQSTHQAGKTE